MLKNTMPHFSLVVHYHIYLLLFILIKSVITLGVILCVLIVSTFHVLSVLLVLVFPVHVTSPNALFMVLFCQLHQCISVSKEKYSLKRTSCTYILNL